MTSKQKNGKFRFSSPRIDMGTAITPLESYEFTGFSRIGTTTIGTLPEFHDFILPLISQWNTQFLHVKFIADFRTMVMACSGHQFGLCRWFTYRTIIPPTVPPHVLPPLVCLFVYLCHWCMCCLFCLLVSPSGLVLLIDGQWTSAKSDCTHSIRRGLGRRLRSSLLLNSSPRRRIE